MMVPVACSGEWPHQHHEILDKADPKPGDDINNDRVQPVELSFEKMARWFAIQFGSERENILNENLKDLDL